MKQTLPEWFEKGLRDLKSEEPEPFHFERTMARVRQKEQRRLNIMSTFTRTAIGVGFFCLIILALILIPVTFTMNVGSTVSVKIPVNTDVSHMDIIKATDGLEGITNSNIRMTPDGMTLDFAFRPTKSRKAENLVREALAGVINDPSGIEFNSENMKVEVGGNALAAITGGRISINTQGLSDEQIESAIIAAFASRGMDVTDVDVETTNDGNERRVEIRVMKELEEGEELECPEITLDLEEGQEGRRIIRREIREDCEE
ncbi:MAG: hypothetical protein P9L92_07030 [Candidatus Electryonea clarkiae]|nr:hypothetical protein [Candidatus Electryonea clarkiae]MDP8286478.1 hypothetical protein [Candidatus Electryonea clarkiae]